MRCGIALSLVMLAGCGLFEKDDGDDAPGADAAPVSQGPYKVTAMVTGLTGTGLVLELKSAANVTRPVASDGAVEFGELAKDTMFDIVVTTQPAAQTCRTQAPPAALTADVTIAVTCSPLDLLISEVGPSFIGGWLEVHNESATAKDLAQYRLRTSGGVDAALPALSIAPGDHVVIKVGGDQIYAGPKTIVVAADSPPWGTGGWIALQKGTSVVDSVMFGGAPQPTSITLGWAGNTVPPISGASIARVQDGFDTDRRADWANRAFMTPGGPNDIDSDTDDDRDGIPDQAEVQGTTFAGIDVYALGARLNQRDIFLEIDRMTHPTNDAGTIPRLAAMDKAVAVFAAKNIVLHIDAGTLFGATYDLGGGNVVPYTRTIGFNVAAPAVSVYKFKAEHMDIRRSAFFHYVLWGDRETDGSAGRAERYGNDMTITLGGIHSGAANQQNFLVNDQALVLVHELGHNLGLAHGGDAEVNYKPNYFSIMNYLYRQGLSNLGTSTEGDRYFLLHDSCGITQSNQLTNHLNTPNPIITFSDGTSAPINEAQISEMAGLGRPTSAPVDYNCSGAVNNGYARDLNDDDITNTLRDHDDWGNMVLAFATRVGGQTFTAGRSFDFATDRGEVVNERM